MKKLLLSTFTLIFGLSVSAQNINDHKVSFNYIQLPLVKIDDSFNSYSVKVEHNYVEANEDSVELYQIKNEAAMTVFHELMKSYQLQVDSLNRTHLIQMADWEKKVNAGVKNPDGTALAMPPSPVYPIAPSYPREEQPKLNTPLEDAAVDNMINIEGYTKGGEDVTVTISISGIRYFPVVENIKKTGTTTKYNYHIPYTLPISIKVESKTQGILLEQEINGGTQNYSLKSFDSKYEYELYMMDNEETLYQDVEKTARNKAFSSINTYLNNQVGYPVKVRGTELYSVKKYKDYDYSDVTNAFTLTSQALYKVYMDRDRASAMDAIDDAIEAIDAILLESNTFDKKSRINDKITAMLQCNKIELLIWKGEYDEAFALRNLAMNSGEGKAKRHLDGLAGFYADQQKRWQANY